MVETLESPRNYQYSDFGLKNGFQWKYWGDIILCILLIQLEIWAFGLIEMLHSLRMSTVWIRLFMHLYLILPSLQLLWYLISTEPTDSKAYKT